MNIVPVQLEDTGLSQLNHGFLLKRRSHSNLSALDDQVCFILENRTESNSFEASVDWLSLPFLESPTLLAPFDNLDSTNMQTRYESLIPEIGYFRYKVQPCNL